MIDFDSVVKQPEETPSPGGWLLVGFLGFLMWAGVTCAFLMLSGCGKVVCPLEYKVDGTWQRCNAIQTTACGTDLVCGGTSFVCLNGAESREACGK